MGVEGKPLKRLMSIFGIACTGLKAGVNEKGKAGRHRERSVPAGPIIEKASRLRSRTSRVRWDRKLLLHQIQHRRGHRHHSSANRWFRHGREFARM
jgi:hypothetical protein